MRGSIWWRDECCLRLDSEDSETNFSMKLFGDLLLKTEEIAWDLFVGLFSYDPGPTPFLSSY